MKNLSIVLAAIAIVGCAKINQETLLEEARVKELCEVDTASYTIHINPIIQNKCMPCHNANRADGGIILENYTEISNYTATDYLLQTIRHESGVAAMPKDAAKLHSCEIQVIERWIQQGAPNN
jgi:uncharacterized membrane protein